MIKCSTESVPGYSETLVKSELVILEAGFSVTRVLNSKIYTLEINSTDISVAKKILSLSNSDFVLFATINEQATG